MVKRNVFDKRRMKSVLSNLREGSKVLEIGAGSGRQLECLADISPCPLELYANDIAFDDRARSSLRAKNIRLFEGAIENVETEARFDAIAATDRTKTRHRRYLMTLALFLMLATSLAPQAERFDAFEKTIPELQDALERGDVTSVELVRQYFARIEAFDQRGPKLNAMIYLNPRALDDAAALDRERREQGPRGPLHGIPVILKDNYDTFDMPTTGGSIALAGHVPDVEVVDVEEKLLSEE